MQPAAAVVAPLVALVAQEMVGVVAAVL